MGKHHFIADGEGIWESGEEIELILRDIVGCPYGGEECIFIESIGIFLRNDGKVMVPYHRSRCLTPNDIDTFGGIGTVSDDIPEAEDRIDIMLVHNLQPDDK